MIDLTRPRQDDQQRPTAKEAEQRTRAAIMAKRLPAVPAGSLLGLTGAMPREDERRAANSYARQTPEEARDQRIQERRERLSPEVQEAARRLRLNLIGAECLDIVYRAQRAAGHVHIQVSRAQIATDLDIPPARAEQLLTGLHQIGALDVRRGLAGQAPRYRALV